MIMEVAYINELKSLQSWINNVNGNLLYDKEVMIDVISANAICYDISIIQDEIRNEYPFYAEKLKYIPGNLFMNSIYGNVIINRAAFGELFVIVQHIGRESVNMAIWNEIHPCIAIVSQELFRDGYYDSAAEKAVKEVESRLRKLFQQLKPGAGVPTKVTDIIGALLSENGAYQFADLTTASGKNYRRGIQCLFEGIFFAYRNPAAHENLQCSKRQAMEQIMLSSQLMYVLDSE